MAWFDRMLGSVGSRPVGLFVSLWAALCVASCLGDPGGPSNLRLTSLLDSPDTLWSGAPGEAVAHPVVVRVTDAQGNPILGASLDWRVQGRGASLMNVSTFSDVNGEASAHWILGTNAKELQGLRVTAQGVSSQSQLAFQAQAIPHVVSRLTLPIDSLLPLRVGDTLPIVVSAVDPYGNTFPATAPVVTVDDTTIATFAGDQLVGGPHRGRTTVRAVSGGVGTAVPLHVTQFVSAIIPNLDTLRSGTVGVTLFLPYSVRDDRDRPVVDTAVTLSVGDSGVIQATGSEAPVLADTATVSFVVVANGSTHVTLSVPGVSASIAVVVAQVPAAITATVDYPKPIVTLPLGTLLPMTCTAVDSNGYVTPDRPALVGTRTGTVTGVDCGDMQISHSGVDTITLAVGPVLRTVPITIAASPVPSSPLGQVAVADSLPGQPGFTWAPSARRNRLGDIEVYYSVYSSAVDSSGYTRADLHRLVWLGGNLFRYDGIVLKHDDDICSPQGQGIENVAIVPRQDSAGWRMLYAAGSNACYGWQVFSAVSTDGRTWTKEPGIRLNNGGGMYGMPPWPVGEGMVIDRLPDGIWRIVVGSFEHVTPPATDKWQITEWRSTDQLQWTYIGTVLTTFDMPTGWQGSVYSPAIRLVAPGLWRMLFTANGRDSPGGRSAIWSAVSTDRLHWQIEGEVLGDASSNLYYAAMVDDEVAFIRQDNGGPMQLTIANVAMP